MKKINMISHLNAIARLFVASFLLQTLKACSLYTGMSTVIIETFDELQCALSEGIPHIIVNQSFSFRSTLEIYGGSRTLIGKSLGGYAVKLTGPINSRLFNITSANLTISSLKLVGSFSSESHSIEYGGLLLAEHSVLKLVNATFSSGVAQCAGAIYSNSSNLYIHDTLFANNSALSSYSVSKSCGGAIASVHAVNMSITGSRFVSNNGYSGGAVSASFLHSILITNSVFSKNSAIDNGGSMSFLSCTNVFISSISCSQSSVSSVGFSALEKSATTYTSFGVDTNSCSFNGGGCLFTSGCNHVTVSISTITSSFSSSNAAAIHSAGDKTFHLVSSNIFANSAQGEAGALMCSGGSVVLAQNNVWTSNTAGGLGGAISLTTNCSLSIVNDRFVSNSVSHSVPLSSGGTFYCYNAHLSINNSAVLLSSASDSSILNAFNCFVSIASSTMEDSSSLSNGLYAGFGSSLHVSNTTFYNMSAFQTASTITCIKTVACFIQHCTFRSNKALALGNIFIENSLAVFSNCNFQSNYVRGDGGAIYTTALARVTISYCTFRNNSVDGAGGAIYAEMSSTLTFLHCSLSDNRALSGGAIYVSHKSSITGLNVTFQDNTAESFGGAVYVEDYSIFNVTTIFVTGSVSPIGGGMYCNFHSSIYLTFLTASNNFAALTGHLLENLFKKTFLISFFNE